MIRRWTVTGNTFLGAFAIDRAIKLFMFDHDIRALSVAIAKGGAVIGTRGYTWAMPDYPITQPDTLFRVASVSKIFTCGAIDQLVVTGALSFETQAFPYLGITKLPLIPVDRDINSITVKHLAMRQSGLKDDLEVEIRSIAKLFGTISRPTRAQVLQYIFGTPLCGTSRYGRQLFQSRIHSTDRDCGEGVGPQLHRLSASRTSDAARHC